MTTLLHPGRYFGRVLAATTHGPFSLQLTRYDASERLSVHAHELPFVCFVVEGGYRERCGADERECGAGTVVVHRGGALHSDVFGASGGTCLNVEWNGVGGAALVRRCGRALRAGAWRTPRFSELGGELADAAFARQRCSEEFVLERMSELAEELARSEIRPDVEPAWIARIEREIDDTPSTPHDVETLARAAGVHRTTLLRAFWKHRGSSVSEAIRGRRLDRAIRAITDSDIPLAQVANDCGYADQSHLCRTLRAATGTSPARLRRLDSRGSPASRVQDDRARRG